MQAATRYPSSPHLSSPSQTSLSPLERPSTLCSVRVPRNPNKTLDWTPTPPQLAMLGREGRRAGALVVWAELLVHPGPSRGGRWVNEMEQHPKYPYYTLLLLYIRGSYLSNIHWCYLASPKIPDGAQPLRSPAQQACSQRSQSQQLSSSGLTARRGPAPAPESHRWYSRLLRSRQVSGWVHWQQWQGSWPNMVTAADRRPAGAAASPATIMIQQQCSPGCL